MMSLLWLWACAPSDPKPEGGDTGSPPADEEPVTFVVGPEGGSASVTDAGGSTLELEFPEGALTADTTFVLGAVDPGSDLARFALSPAGVVLWAPATATLRGDAGIDADSAFSWVDGDLRTLVPSAVAGTLEGELSVLGGYGDELYLRSTPGGSTILAVAAIDCEAEAAALSADLANASPAGTPEEMAAHWSRHRAIKERCEAAQVAAVSSAACSAYGAAEVAAAAVAINDYPTYQTIVGRLLKARGDVQIAGEDTCDVSGYPALLDAKFEQFLTFVGIEFERLRQANDLDSQIAMFRKLAKYSAVCRVTALSDEVCGRLDEGLLPDVLDLMRLTAWNDCRADDDPTLLAYMHGGSLATPREPEDAPADQVGGTGDFYSFADFTYADLALDVAHCASQIEVDVFDDATTLPIELEDQGVSLGVGAAPGAQVVTSPVVVPADGALEIGGSVHALICADGSVSSDALVARVNGVEVARSPQDGLHFSLTDDTWDLVVADLLTTAGLPGSTTAFSLEIWREGEGCGRTPADLLLYTLQVQVGSQLATATLLYRGNDTFPSTYGNRVYVVTPVWVDCEAEEREVNVDEVVLVEDRSFPTSLSVGPVLVDAVVDASSAALRVTGAIAGPVSDKCDNGAVETYYGSLSMAAAGVMLTPSAPVTVTIGGDPVAFDGGGGLWAYVYPDEATFRASGSPVSTYNGPLSEVTPQSVTPPQVLVVAAYLNLFGPVTLEDHEVLRLGIAAAAR